MELISIQKAIQLVKVGVKPIGVERILLSEAYGRVLANDIAAKMNHPEVKVTAVDGYAVKSDDLTFASDKNFLRLKLTDTIKAGKMPSKAVHSGDTQLVFTGAPIPDGTDAVVMREDITIADKDIVFTKPIFAGKNVRDIGEDFKIDEVVVPKGTRMGAAEIGMAAEVNRSYLFVYRVPIVSIVSTGDELLDLGDTQPNRAAIRDSNSYTLTGLLKQAGADFIICKRLKDDPESIGKTLEMELNRSDVVITTGGVSAGDYDFVKKIAPEIGVDIIFHGILQKPGKPILFGRYGKNRYMLGLPGFPVSSAVGFLLYAYPLIKKLAGFKNTDLPRVKAVLDEDFHRKKAKREELARVKVKYDLNNGFHVIPDSKKQGSGILTSMVGDAALMDIPMGINDIKKGNQVTIILIKPISSFGELA